MGLNGGHGIVLSLVFAVLALNHAVEASRLSLSKKEELEIERQLRILNKPAVKSFKTQYGQIFDCVDIHKQPAFDHPLLKNHTLQVKPSSYPKRLMRTNSTKRQINFSIKERCPSGTVLIRRTQKDDLIRAKSYSYRPLAEPTSGKFFAAIIFDSDLEYSGAGALMDVFELGNVSINQASFAHIVLTNGGGGILFPEEVIDFGWHILPQITGDNVTHLYTYWTRDGYKSTGCFNMLCPGYVQVSNGLTPGMIIPAGKGAIKLNVHKDSQTENWLLVFEDNDNELLGYFPKEMFRYMREAKVVQMGGVTFSYYDEPSPPMGSGVFPQNPGACEFTQVELKYGGDEFVAPPEKPILYADHQDYYNVWAAGDEGGGGIGYKFEFGGPGGFKKN